MPPSRLALASALLLILATAARSQPADDGQDYFVGTSAFVLYNLVPDPQPPRFMQLNVGVEVTPRDAVSLEAITWQYYGPLGRPYGSAFDSEASGFPGRVQAFGVGLAYKRVLRGPIYVAVHSAPMLQRYLDDAGDLIQTGFQLFNSYRLGAEVELLSGRLFLQPSVAGTHWPVLTNLPGSFQAEEDKWPNYFLLEPGLHVGVRL